MVVGFDQLTSEKAQSVLRTSQRYALRQLSVILKPEGVVLLGQVKSYYDKQQAQEAVRAVCDLPLINQIDVV